MIVIEANAADIEPSPGTATATAMPGQDGLSIRNFCHQRHSILKYQFIGDPLRQHEMLRFGDADWVEEIGESFFI